MSAAVETRPSSGQYGLTYGQIVGEIRERNYALIPGPVPPGSLRQLFDSYAGFLELDEDTKEQFSGELTIPGMDEPLELGYYSTVAGQKQRISGKVAKDTKSLFHATSESLVVFNSLIESGGVDFRAAHFIGQMSAFYARAERQALEVLEPLETGAPGLTGQFFRYGTPPNFIIRLLAYWNINAQPGEVIGKHHYDKSALTFEYGETHPGFEIGRKKEGEMTPVSCPPGWSLFFPGEMIAALDCEGLVKEDFLESGHGVRQTAGRPYSRKIARMAAVSFVDPIAPSGIARIH